MNKDENKTNSVSLPSIGELLDNTGEIYGQRIKTFLGIMLLPAVFSVISVTVGEPVFLFFVISMIISTWASMALVYAIKFKHENIGVIESYRRILHKALSGVWITFLTFFVIALGFVFFIIPGLVFLVWFDFALYILIDEDLKGVQALKKSKKYVEGNFGKIFWRMMFIIFIFIVFFIALSIIFSVTHIPFSEQVINLVVDLFLVPFMAIYLFLLYSSVKKTHIEHSSAQGIPIKP